MNHTEAQTYSTDWINSKPVYYNTKTHRVAFNMNDVIDWNNFEFDPEGVYNYLYFGYQVFEQTPVKNVRYLRHSSELTQYRDENNGVQISISEKADPIEHYVGRKYSVDEAIDILHNHIRTFEQNSGGTNNQKRFLLPLSGGYDSRLLASMIEDKSRIDAFTYDISLSERYSFEVIRAQEVSRRLSIHWEKLPVNEYWSTRYINKNFDAFSLEMPVHAAYHMEMYDKIIAQYGQEYIALSGSVGDWWSGLKVPLRVPNDHHDFSALFFNHGISIPREFITVNTGHEIKEKMFADNKHRLKDDPMYRIVFARRGRIGLATYIYRTAALYFDTYTPFYDIHVALSQLNLPDDQRKDRMWLSDYFRRQHLDVEHHTAKRLVTSNDYGLDLKTAYRSLDESDLLHHRYFQTLVDRRRIDWINAQIVKCKYIPFPLLTRISQMFFSIDRAANAAFIRTIFGPGFDYAYRKIFNSPDLFKAISEWSVLKPLEIAQQRAEGSVTRQ